MRLSSNPMRLSSNPMRLPFDPMRPRLDPMRLPFDPMSPSSNRATGFSLDGPPGAQGGPACQTSGDLHCGWDTDAIVAL
jgi:hypothetical protein